MKKEEQKEINEKVFAEYRAFLNDENAKVPHRKLRHCSAEVFETKNYYVLRSYNTIVACINKRTNILYDFLRYAYGYTATSAQHIAKFRHDYTPYPWNYPVYTWRAV